MFLKEGRKAGRQEGKAGIKEERKEGRWFEITNERQSMAVHHLI